VAGGGGGLYTRVLMAEPTFPDPRTLFIVRYPDPVLRTPAAPVEAVDDSVRSLAERMVELMRQAEGIGLAAPQAGVPLRLFVCHVPPSEGREADGDPAEATSAPLACINPVLSELSGEMEDLEEGCLSLPEILGTVRRPAGVTMEATGLDGERYTLRATGLLARCLQHEYDHLDGVLIIDKMQQLSRMKNRRAIRELEKAAM